MLAMKRPASNEQVEISSDDSSSSDAETDVTLSQQPNGEPDLGLSSEGIYIAYCQVYYGFDSLCIILTLFSCHFTEDSDVIIPATSI